jgi:hypothetical protein
VLHAGPHASTLVHAALTADPGVERVQLLSCWGCTLSSMLLCCCCCAFLRRLHGIVKKWWAVGVSSCPSQRRCGTLAAAVAGVQVYVQCLAARHATHHSTKVVHKAASCDDACCQCHRRWRLSSVDGCAHVYMYTGEGGWWCEVTDTFTCQQRAPCPEYLLSTVPVAQCVEAGWCVVRHTVPLVGGVWDDASRPVTGLSFPHHCVSSGTHSVYVPVYCVCTAVCSVFWSSS